MAPTQTSGMTMRVLEALAEEGVITPEQVSTIGSQMSAGRASTGRDVISRGLATDADVSAVLESSLGVPRVELQSYAPDAAALELVPATLARELGVLPLFEIEGVLTVAIGKAGDVFDLDTLAARIGLEVEPVLANPRALSQALEQHYPDVATDVSEVAVAPEHAGSTESTEPAEPESQPDDVGTPELGMTDATLADAAPIGAPEPVAAPTHDAPVDVGAPLAPGEALPGRRPKSRIRHDDSSPIDLDVLAVADPARTMVLVTEIFERAVRLGATKVHVVPDGGSFSLAFRVAGQLSEIASAPISLQSSLVDAVRAFMGVAKPALGQPAIGRLTCELAGRQVTLSLSAVKAAAGYRLVVSLDEEAATLPSLAQLGLPEAEVRVLESIIERRSGLLVFVSPIGEGSSETYYSVLAHAVASGKTAFSVERSVSRTVHGAAQVAALPGSPVAPAAYFSAGLGQDTDVMAIDPVENPTDLRLAIGAAAAGKLVVATFAASGAMNAVSRFLEMGVDSTSLASALTAVVAQRLVSTVCPACGAEDDSGVAESMPGNDSGVRGRVGAGCSVCRDSGHGGLTRLFEVVPVTEPLRAAIEREAGQAELVDVALAAGMRSFGVDALEKLKSGSVSASELNRVLRFTE